MSRSTLWTWIFVVLTFATYITIAWRSRVKDTKGFYVAGQGVPTVANGAAVAADWMSAASFLSMAGIIAFAGYDGSVYLMGWTGGYVLLALLLAPYLRKFGKYTVPDFVGDRYSDTARLVAAIAAIFVSFTYVVGQMRGVGVVFSRFLGSSITVGIMVGMAIVLFYAVLGGMKGITWTQVAQYSVLIVAYLIPAIAIAAELTGIPIPQVSFGRVMAELDVIQAELGFNEYSSPFVRQSQLNVFLITASLMIGTAGLPHVIVRFYTTRSVRAARWSAFWALFFIALLYTTAPAVGVFAKYNLLQTVADAPRADMPPWFDAWEETGLLTHNDLNEDGVIQYTPGEDNELTVDNDIMVLATPEVAGLPAPIIGLVAAGGLAAALSTASGLLLVISSSVAHDFYFRRLRPESTEKQQLMVGRITMAGAVVVAGYFGVNPPGFVAEVVALAFGLAAASFFPTIVLGIFWKRANAAGAVAGMGVGLTITAAYMIAVLYGDMEPIFGISPQGFGVIGSIINFVVAIAVTNATAPPPVHIQELVDSVRYPSSVGTTPEGVAQ